MRLIWIKPNAESKPYGVLQSQFACRRNICREKPVRHFAPSHARGFHRARWALAGRLAAAIPASKSPVDNKVCVNLRHATKPFTIRFENAVDGQHHLQSQLSPQSAENRAGLFILPAERQE
ncbi:hypothetical protein M0654_11650 [Rhizobium sp. NTR19]|uniref:Uncharacterized protein n=1 Tax=Neorhizobium turbinariae TaxID=2937795 RepID=A0ABT0IRZ8_9HYPH|nr:hypothetical protein [Neorhizobium turbinariae]MCK8780637.1 hypothetical protein [Neorhizobium turbinariae]